MSVKKLLIITPHLAPENHAAVYRTHKLIKYLPERGWKVYVVAPDRNYEYKTNPSLLEEIPSSVEVHRTLYPEPSLRGVRDLIQKKHVLLKDSGREFSEETHGGSIAANPSNTSKYKKKAKSIYSSFLHNTAYDPDRHWLWGKTAFQKSKELIKEFEIPVVLTTSLPFTTISVGAKLKRELGVKWISDHRDPLTYTNKHFSSDNEVFTNQRSLERLSLLESDALTVLSSSHKLILCDQYGVEYSDKIHFISTGADENYMPEECNDKEKRIVFIGEFLEQYGDRFFKILEEAHKKDPSTVESYKFEFVGNTLINKKRVLNFIGANKTLPLFEFTDQISQRDVYKKLSKARAGLLCTSQFYPWWTLFAKLVDYIALGTDVIALVPNPSESRKWLELSNLGVFLDGTKNEASSTLIEYLKNPVRNHSEDSIKCREIFFARAQLDSFEEVLLSSL